MEKIKFEIKEGVLYGPYPEGVELDLNNVTEMLNQRLEFLNGRKVPALIDTSGIKKATKEARDFMATSHASEGLVAAAVLSESIFSRYVSNFFIKISLVKTPIPIKLFQNKDDALSWLEQYGRKTEE